MSPAAVADGPMSGKGETGEQDQKPVQPLKAASDEDGGLSSIGQQLKL